MGSVKEGVKKDGREKRVIKVSFNNLSSTLITKSQFEENEVKKRALSGKILLIYY